MSKTLDKVRDEAMRLSVEERSWLAHDLLHSLTTDEEREIAAEWVAVAERRIDEIEAGTAKLVSADEAIVHARAAVANARKASRRS